MNEFKNHRWASYCNNFILIFCMTLSCQYVTELWNNLSSLFFAALLQFFEVTDISSWTGLSEVLRFSCVWTLNHCVALFIADFLLCLGSLFCCTFWDKFQLLIRWTHKWPQNILLNKRRSTRSDQRLLGAQVLCLQSKTKSFPAVPTLVDAAIQRFPPHVLPCI